ncbi:hypothetical protein O6H91_02G025800 [Diphasiastrum complanatum]|uniref:Uncharacterized protein n=1 Tax=Diphasiastrum complanatum TaxID=34168 RepID=A0ACC2EDR5_DIPCM|nr:hypothetical protein O6H91_02G025800 [Diphasiastrum complanatum]
MAKIMAYPGELYKQYGSPRCSSCSNHSNQYHEPLRSVIEYYCRRCDEKKEEKRPRCSLCSTNCATKHYCNMCDKEKMDQMESKMDFLQLKWQPEGTRDCENELILLQASDGECVPVNGLILVSRSRVFDVMLKANMVERQTKTIKLEDMNTAVLHSFVRFLYSANASAEDLQQHSPNLLLAANKYEVDLLKGVCENFMVKYLTKDSVLTYLEVGYLCDSFLVKNAAFDVVSRCYTEYELDEGFQSLGRKHPGLAVEFCKYLLPSQCFQKT